MASTETFPLTGNPLSRKTAHWETNYNFHFIAHLIQTLISQSTKLKPVAEETGHHIAIYRQSSNRLVIPQLVRNLKYIWAPPHPFLFLLFASGSASRATGTLSNSFSTWQSFKFFKKALLQLLNLPPKDKPHSLLPPSFSIFLHLAWVYTLTIFSIHSPTGWRHFSN